MRADVHLRCGRSADETALWDLRTRCVRQLCSSHYPPQVIARWSAAGPPARYAALLAAGGSVVAEDNRGTLLGYGIIDLEGNEVDALFVDPGHAGQGTGHVLMRELIARADPTRDIVLSASLNAVGFYLRAGFVAEGLQDYPHPSGVLLAAMRMRLPASTR